MAVCTVTPFISLTSRVIEAFPKTSIVGDTIGVFSNMGTWDWIILAIAIVLSAVILWYLFKCSVRSFVLALLLLLLWIIAIRLIAAV